MKNPYDALHQAPPTETLIKFINRLRKLKLLLDKMKKMDIIIT